MMEMGKLRNDEVHEQITLVIKVLAAWMKAAVFRVSLQGHHYFVIKNTNLGTFYFLKKWKTFLTLLCRNFLLHFWHTLYLKCK
jgi:hypothetical protein